MPLNRRQIRRQTIVWFVLPTVAAGALGWAATFFLLGRSTNELRWEALGSIGYHISIAVFLAVSVSVISGYYLQVVIGDPSKDSLSDAGVDKVFSNRGEAIDEFLRVVDNGNTRRIDIVGISLRDFLGSVGGLHEVWTAISRRLEADQDKPPSERVEVKLLFLDPKSNEGLFRHKLERQYTGNSGLRQEVTMSVEVVRQLLERIPNSALSYQFYEHCPFSFVFASDMAVYTEQYLYRNPRERTGGLPLLKYGRESQQFRELLESVDSVWKHSYPAELLEHRVGTAKAINESGIRNIFRREQRSQLADAEHDALDAEAKDGEVKILAITGKFFVLGRLGPVLRKASEPDERGVKVQFAILNPVSQQAILRAVADQVTPDNVARITEGLDMGETQGFNSLS